MLKSDLGVALGAAALWLIAGSLALMALLFLCVVGSCLTYLFVIFPIEREEQRQEMIRREQWRRF